MRRALVLATLLVLLSAWPAAALSVTRSIPVGSQPFGVAAVGDLLYVANNGGSTVSVIDTATNTVTGSISVGSGPAEIAADPAAGRAYVANFNSNTVSVVDTAARVTVATIGTGGLGVAVDAGLGRLYVVTPSQLTVFDTATLQPVSTLPAPSGAGWWAVAVDPLRHIGYLGGLGGQGITVVDLTTNAILTTIGVAGPIRFALAADPARGLLFAATDTKPGTLFVIDAATNAVIRTTAVGDFPSHIMPVSASTVYVTDLGSNDLAVVDPGTGAVTRTPLGAQPAGLAAVASTTYVAINGANAVVTLGNNPPTVDSVIVSPTNPKTSDTLIVTVNARDADGDSLTYAYQWMLNGADIPGATTVSLDLSVAGNGDRGDAISLRIAVSDATHTTTATSTQVVVADTAPVLDSVSIAQSSARTNDLLTAAATGHDVDTDGLAFAYQWTRNGTDIAGATGSSLDLSGSSNGDRGDSMALRVTASDGSLASPPLASNPVVIADSAPVATVALSPASPTTQSVLVATATASDPDGDVLTMRYVWKVNGVTRQTTTTNAMSDTFDLGRPGYGNKGDLVTVQLTVSDATLASGTASASVTVSRGH
jgi:YVTN family beta-propeller protein